MPTLLDAFVVSIGWDTKAWDKGERDIAKGQERVTEGARTSANRMEESGRRAAASFRTVRNEVLGLFLAFQGASSLTGFVRDIISSDAQLGRFSDNVGVAIGKVAGLRGAVAAVGGNANDSDSAFQILSNLKENRLLRGDLSAGADLQGLGINPGDLRDKEATMYKLNAAANRMDKEQFFNRASALGFTPAFINLLEKSPADFRRLWQEQERNARVTEEDAKAAQKFDEQLAKLQTTITGKVRPAVTSLVEGLNDIAGKNGENVGELATTAIAGIGAAAFAAAPEIVLVAGAVMALVEAYQLLHNVSKMDPKAQAEAGASLRSKFLGKLGEGDFSGAVGVLGEAINTARGAGGSTPSGAGASAPAGVSGLYNTLAQKYGKPVADGIWAGIGAESNWNPNAFNGSGGGQGAYGLGQWRGARLRALRAKYGRNPSAKEQIEFLMSELDGGDAGGASVVGAGSRDAALRAYVHNFMRPSASGAASDMRRGYASWGARAPVRGSGGGGSTVTIGQVVVNTPNAESFARKDLGASLAKRGVVIQSGSGMNQ